MTAFVCICSEEYLGYYKVLYESLKKFQMPYQILYYIGNERGDLNGFDRVVNINHWYDECNKSYTKLERICSLRARAVLDAFEMGYDKIVFLGAKVQFFSYPGEMIELLNDYKAVVTPHILEPLPEDGKFPSNATVSFTGHISTDVVAFKKDPEIIKFLQWQDEIMKTKCKTTQHTYLDQSWLNFLPFFVDNVKILRDPAYNVAYWNYKQRDLKNMVCFQYSGLDLNNPENISTHQNRYKTEGDFLEFLKDYARKVKCVQ